jgi:hypothetical protein
MTPIKRAKTAYDRANLEAAGIILQDPERHGGEHSQGVQWARLFLARFERERKQERAA